MREIARATLLFLSLLIREIARVVIPVSSARDRFARGEGEGEEKKARDGGFRSKVASRTIGRVKMNPRDLYMRERNSQGAINLRAEVGTPRTVLRHAESLDFIARRATTRQLLSLFTARVAVRCACAVGFFFLPTFCKRMLFSSTQDGERYYWLQRERLEFFILSFNYSIFLIFLLFLIIEFNLQIKYGIIRIKCE